MLKALAESWRGCSFASREQEASMKQRAKEALARYSNRSVRAGKDSLVEKPFCVYIPEARVFFKGTWLFLRRSFVHVHTVL